jgi:hypothetical protein
MHAHFEWYQQLPEKVVGLFAVVLNKIAGDQRAICAPITGDIVVEHPLQGIGSDSASQFAVRVGKQMRIGQVQNPNRIPVSRISGCLNWLLP